MKKVSEGLIVAACFILAFVAGFCAISAYKYYTSSLPKPPAITATEMTERIAMAATNHIAMCVACNEASVNERRLPDCYQDALKAALIVGDWEAIGCNRDTREIIWQYVGVPLEGYRWSIMRQCWIRYRKVLE